MDVDQSPFDKNVSQALLEITKKSTMSREQMITALKVALLRSISSLDDFHDISAILIFPAEQKITNAAFNLYVLAADMVKLRATKDMVRDFVTIDLNEAFQDIQSNLTALKIQSDAACAAPKKNLIGYYFTVAKDYTDPEPAKREPVTMPSSRQPLLRAGNPAAA